MKSRINRNGEARSGNKIDVDPLEIFYIYILYTSNEIFSIYVLQLWPQDDGDGTVSNKIPKTFYYVYFVFDYLQQSESKTANVFDE